ncbi:MAG: hypothetical protein MJ082_03855 [Clostridia bacterium]|nr:hypothetical protein [Clostridia bacterium]
MKGYRPFFVGTGVSAAAYAVYEDYTFGAKSYSHPKGVTFGDDTASYFGINKKSASHNDSYVFTSAIGSKTTVSPAAVAAPGSDGNVLLPGFSAMGTTTKVQTITGYDVTGKVSIVMQKTTVGSSAPTYRVRTLSGSTLTDYTASTEDAIGRYFNIPDTFTTEAAFVYDFKIANSASTVTPAGTLTVAIADGNLTIKTYDMSATSAKADVIVEYVKNDYTSVMRVTASDGPAYPLKR